MILTPFSSADETRPSARATIEILRDHAPRRLDASELGSLRPTTLRPVRTSRSYKDRKNYAGHYWSATTGTLLWFESLYEKSALMVLDRDPAVVGLATQPMRIRWSEPRDEHFPDILAERSDGTLLIVDVKPRGQIRGRDAHLFSRTAALCERHGVSYRLFADRTDMEDWNLRFLGGYRFARWACPDVVADHLRDHLGEVRTLSEWLPVFEGSHAPARGLLNAALWHGALTVDLTRRLEITASATCRRGTWQ